MERPLPAVVTDNAPVARPVVRDGSHHRQQRHQHPHQQPAGCAHSVAGERGTPAGCGPTCPRGHPIAAAQSQGRANAVAGAGAGDGNRRAGDPTAAAQAGRAVLRRDAEAGAGGSGNANGRSPQSAHTRAPVASSASNAVPAPAPARAPVSQPPGATIRGPCAPERRPDPISPDRRQQRQLQEQQQQQQQQQRARPRDAEERGPAGEGSAPSDADSRPAETERREAVTGTKEGGAARGGGNSAETESVPGSASDAPRARARRSPAVAAESAPRKQASSDLADEGLDCRAVRRAVWTCFARCVRVRGGRRPGGGGEGRGGAGRRKGGETVEGGSDAPPPDTFVSFPFEEGYQRSGAGGAPPVSRYFLDDGLWRRFAMAHLGGRASASVPGRYCELASTPRKRDTYPQRLVDGITARELLCANGSTRVYAATVRDPDTGRRYRCVVKVVEVGWSCPGRRWTDSRWSLRDDEPGPLLIGYRRLRCCPAWSEPIALSKVYPSRYLGGATYYDRRKRTWFSAIAMPHYRGTLWSLTSNVLPLFGSSGRLRRGRRGRAGGAGGDDGGDGPAWPDVFLAALAQIVLYTIPRAKKSHLVSHNDLKIDNVGYRHTARRHVYARIHFGGGDCADASSSSSSSVLLAIPTFGRMFYLIDFGWASFMSGKEGVLVSSTCPIYSLPKPMRAWNPCTDYAQIGYSLWDRLQEHFERGPNGLYALDESWWELLDALVALAATDDGLGVLRLTEEKWPEGFYAAVSRRCHFRDADRFVAAMGRHYACPPHAVPRGRPLIEYDVASMLRSYDPSAAPSRGVPQRRVRKGER